MKRPQSLTRLRLTASNLRNRIPTKHELAARVHDGIGRPMLVQPNQPVRQIHGNVYTTDVETRAVFLLGDTLWSNQTYAVQHNVVELANSAWAALPGRHIKVVAAERPVDAVGRAREYKQTAPDPSARWDAHVAAGADRQLDIGLSEIVVVADVYLCPSKDGAPGEGWEIQHREVFAHLANPALKARKAPDGQVDWLIHAAMAPGHPVPEYLPGRACDDVGGFTEGVVWEAPVKARCVEVTSDRGPSTWVAALTFSTMAPREAPGELPPWMSACYHAPFPVHLVVSGKVETAGEAAERFARRATLLTDQIEHLNDHRDTVQESTAEIHATVTRLADRLRTADPTTESQVRFVARLIVAAPDREELEERLAVLRRMYRQDVQWRLAHTVLDQVSAINELAPGVHEPVQGYMRYGPVTLWGGGVPNVTGQIGQRNGMYFGYTTGQQPRRAVAHDPWYPPEKLNQAAIYPVLGDPGAGRSTLGLRVIDECVEAGIPVTALDPAGEWVTAAKLDEERVKVVHLSGTASDTAGLLAGHVLSPDPDPAEFGDPYVDGIDMDAYLAAKATASATRIAFAIDDVKMILDDDTWSEKALRNAVKDAARYCDGNLWGMVDWLDRPDETDSHGVVVRDYSEYRRLAGELTTAAHSHARLLFPPRVQLAKPADQLLDAQVVIITLQGMQFPAAGTDESRWTGPERAAALVMRKAAFLARRLVEVRNERTPRCRQALIVDEASWLANWSHGQTWISSFVRHVRRWNVALYLMTQHPEDLRRLDPTGNTFASGGFIGTTKQESVGSHSLALTGAAAGLEKLLKRLSWVTDEDEGQRRWPGEFLWTDADDRTERVRLDLEPYPELKALADTTPGSKRLPKRVETGGAHPDALAV